jgi:hypothetical protein
MKIDDWTRVSKQLIEKVFLNYSYIYELFKNKQFHVSKYSLNHNFLKEMEEFLGLKLNNKTEDSHLIPISVLIQFVYISINDSINKCPKSIGNQLCSRIRRLNGFNIYINKFIEDCDNTSIKECAIVAHTQLNTFHNARIRLLYNFNRKIIYSQKLKSGKYFYLYENKIGLFKWNKGGHETSSLLKEIELKKKASYKLLKVFEKLNNEFKLIIATKTTIDFIDANGITLTDGPIEIQKDEEIEDILLVNDEAFVVYFTNKDYLKVFKSNSKDDKFTQIDLGSTVKYFNYDSNRFTGTNIEKSLFITVLLSNSDLEVYEIDRKTVSFELRLKYSFGELIPVSAEFHLYQKKYDFELFITFNTNQFLSIKMEKGGGGIDAHTIETNINYQSEFNVLSYYENLVVLADCSQTYIYNTMTKKWFTIIGKYTRVVLSKISENIYRIYCYNEKYFDFFLLRADSNSYKIAKLISRFKFIDDIQIMSFNRKQIHLMIR